MLYRIRQILIYLIIILGGGAALAIGAISFLFGEGRGFPDRSSDPILPEGTLELVLESDQPLGNVVVGPGERVFFTLNPAADPEGGKLFEWVDGQPVPFPAVEQQDALLDTPLGLDFDSDGHLWVIDPARHGWGQARLLEFDIETGEVLFSFDIPRTAAPRGSFLQDLAISPDGDWVYIADAGTYSRRPAIVVVETAVKRAHRMLESHATVLAQDFLIRNQIRSMSWYRGYVSMKQGVNGIAMSDDGAWLYYAAMNHEAVHRVPPAILHNPNIDIIPISVEIQTVSGKPLSDGIEVDAQGNVYIADIEHQAIHRHNPLLGRETLIKDSRIRWADQLDLGPDGALYITDSALPEVVWQSAGNHRAAAPYRVWKFTPPKTPEPAPIPGSAETIVEEPPEPEKIPAPVVLELE